MNILVSLTEEAARGADSIAFIPSAGDEETALNPYYNSEQIGPHNQHQLYHSIVHLHH